MNELSAPYVLEYAYRRSTGPVIGRFLTGLRDGRIEGVKTGDGRTIVPPIEYDPQTGEAITEWVELATEGEVGTDPGDDDQRLNGESQNHDTDSETDGGSRREGRTRRNPRKTIAGPAA